VGQCVAAAASRGWVHLPPGEVPPGLPRPAAAFFAVLPGCSRPRRRHGGVLAACSTLGGRTQHRRAAQAGGTWMRHLVSGPRCWLAGWTLCCRCCVGALCCLLRPVLAGRLDAVFCAASYDGPVQRKSHVQRYNVDLLRQPWSCLAAGEDQSCMSLHSNYGTCLCIVVMSWNRIFRPMC
jgi:hypothetical protein